MKTKSRDRLQRNQTETEGKDEEQKDSRQVQRNSLKTPRGPDFQNKTGRQLTEDTEEFVYMRSTLKGRFTPKTKLDVFAAACGVVSITLKYQKKKPGKNKRVSVRHMTL